MANNFKYEDLWDYWLESKSQPTPKGFEKVESRKGTPTPYNLTPEDMIALVNAISQFDLYMRPNYAPFQLDYPTSALNIENRRYGKIGIPEAIAMASQEPKNRLSNIYSMNTARKNYPDIPQWLQRFIPQGIYEHEVGHYEDPRLNPEAKNYGYLTGMGLQGNVAAREYPAIQSENKFWEWVLNNKELLKKMIKSKKSK